MRLLSFLLCIALFLFHKGDSAGAATRGPQSAAQEYVAVPGPSVPDDDHHPVLLAFSGDDAGTDMVCDVDGEEDEDEGVKRAVSLRYPFPAFPPLSVANGRTARFSASPCFLQQGECLYLLHRVFRI